MLQILHYFNLIPGYAQSFCSNTKIKALNWQRKLDNHSPNHERINMAIKNLPIFKDIFHCADTSKLVSKKHSCTVW